MAELTEEEKIVIGVCSAIAGLILIGILIFICCVLYRRNDRRGYRGRRDRNIKEKIIDDYHKDFDRFYSGDDYIKRGPPPMVDPEPEYRGSRWESYDMYKEPLPPPVETRTRWERYDDYKDPLPIMPPIPRAEARKPRWERYEDYNEDMYVPVHKTYARETSREIDYDTSPIVIPIREPEFIRTEVPEPETIYLKYHQDDMALLPSTRYYRRPETRVIRRTRSFDDIRPMYDSRVVRYTRPPPRVPKSKYVGEWGHTIFQPWEMPFNDRAARAGRDPFLWSG